MRLLKYKFQSVVPFGDGEYWNVYSLLIEKRYLFGLFKKEIEITYRLSVFDSIAEYEQHWDNLIATKERITVNPELLTTNP
jgi:hypothetical protein